MKREKDDPNIQEKEKGNQLKENQNNAKTKSFLGEKAKHNRRDKNMAKEEKAKCGGGARKRGKKVHEKSSFTNNAKCLLF